MKNLLIGALVASVGVIAIAAPAGAAPITYVYTGKIFAGGVSQGSVFGLSGGTSLTNLSYTATYTFDPDLGSIYLSPSLSQVIGGSLYGLAGFGRSTLTVNGVSVTVAENYSDRVRRQTPYQATYDDLINDSRQNTSDANGLVNSYIHHFSSSNNLSLLSGLDFSGAVTFDGLGGHQSGDGFFQLEKFSRASNRYEYRAEGQLTIDSISVVGSAGGVPEPSAWAMMVIGFGAAGGAFRRKRLVLRTTMVA